MKFVGVVVWQDGEDGGLGSHVWAFDAENADAAWLIVEQKADECVADRPSAINFNTNLLALETA